MTKPRPSHEPFRLWALVMVHPTREMMRCLCVAFWKWLTFYIKMISRNIVNVWCLDFSPMLSVNIIISFKSICYCLKIHKNKCMIYCPILFLDHLVYFPSAWSLSYLEWWVFQIDEIIHIDWRISLNLCLDHTSLQSSHHLKPISYLFPRSDVGSGLTW